MSAAPDVPAKVVPAQLDFFAIYNPSLGTSDETVANQIVYFSSKESRERSRQYKNVPPSPETLREETNEQLRQVGLAQGMVEFGRSFSDGSTVDTVETEKSRIVLHELEAGWWVLASINLTFLPPPVLNTPATKGQIVEEGKPEYSSREVKPAILVLGDILRAHSTFLLHHASSMSALFVRTKRSKFISILTRYWDTFLSSWTVLMHGNPANSLYSGIKIAGSGELGIGVGEEDRGSGEREVLEGFVGRVDGLVDIVASKFAAIESVEGKSNPKQAQAHSPWLGSGNEPGTDDGAVFLGTGALSRKSIRDVTHWVEDLYRWGPHAYGVMDNPTSHRKPRKSKKKDRSSMANVDPQPQPQSSSPTRAKSRDTKDPSQDNEQNPIDSKPLNDRGSSPDTTRRRPSIRRGLSFASTDSETSKGQNKLVQYLKLGYGTHWSLGHSSSHAKSETPVVKRAEPPKPADEKDIDAANETNKMKKDSEGHFLVGLLGDIEEAIQPSLDGESVPLMIDDADGENNRLHLRTLTVELEREQDARAENEVSIDLGSSNGDARSAHHSSSERTGNSITSFESQDRNKTKKLRVLVYVKKPFIFVLLFELRTEVLALPSFYRSIHHQLSPLVKPLLRSTTFKPSKPDVPAEANSTPIYDLIWDPKLLTVTSTIPNIPDPHDVRNVIVPPVWSRLESLNTHMQIILTYTAAMTSNSELERTSKTSRGWWIVWTRIPDPDPPATPLNSGDVKVPLPIPEESSPNKNKRNDNIDTPQNRSSITPVAPSNAGTSMISGSAHPFLETKNKDLIPLDKEIFLIRRASDHVAGKMASRFSGNDSSGSAESWVSGPGKLVQGIGVDTKWYIDSLLNLSR